MASFQPWLVKIRHSLIQLSSEKLTDKQELKMLPTRERMNKLRLFLSTRMIILAPLALSKGHYDSLVWT